MTRQRAPLVVEPEDHEPEADRGDSAEMEEGGSLAHLRELRSATEGHFGMLLRQERALANVQKDLKALVLSVEQRAELDLALKEALTHSAALERLLAEIEQQKHDELKDAIALSVALERQLGQLEKEKDAARDEAERQGELLRLGEKEFERLERDYKSLKRKYRSTLKILEAEREKLRDFKSRLAQAEVVVARYERSLPWTVYRRLARLIGRFRKGAGRLTGNSGRQRLIALLDRSPLFDREWYLKAYPDVAATGADPARHFLEHGWREGRDPSPAFSTTAYLKANSDVVKAGINPLIHFIEFGCSEGRGAPANRLAWLPAQSPADAFGPAAPCAEFPIPESVAAAWTKSADFEPGDGLLVIDDVPVGYVSEGDGRNVEVEFQRLKSLSGFAEPLKGPLTSEAGSVHGKLMDAWFINNATLRTRWSGDGATFVIRAYQHDPDADGRPTLVGEGCAQSATDVIDLALTNPYFPVLLLCSDGQGSIIGSEMLAFPSLCRGGPHYSELVALSANDEASERPALDLVGHSGSLARGLMDLRNGTSKPTVALIEVDLAGSDGTHPMFQPDFRSWLLHVCSVGVRARQPHSDSPGSDYLAQAVMLDDPGQRAEGAGVLVIAGDMIPSIAALSATAESAEGADTVQAVLPVSFAPLDPSQPSSLISLAGFGSNSLADGAPNYPIAWARFVSATDLRLAREGLPAAIKLAGPRGLSESELLVPVMDGLPTSEGREGVTWIVYPGTWEEEALAQSFESLSLQAGSKDQRIAIVGAAGGNALGLAEHFFPSRVRLWPDAASAIRASETALIGYLGPGVLLHDDRTSQVLSAMLRDTAVASAACVVVSADKRGKGWQVALADCGELAAPAKPQAEAIWRANFPVAMPPRDLWLARTSSVVDWLSGDGALGQDEGAHLCTSFVAASYITARSDQQSPIRVPRAAHSSTRMEELYG